MTDSFYERRVDVLKEQPSDSCGGCGIKEAELLLTVTELARLISFSEKSIYQLVHRKVIPYTKISGALRFRKCDITAWIEDNTFKPRSKECKKQNGAARTGGPRLRPGTRTPTDMDRIVEQTRRKYLER
jgi:excisionase family DNA binding protein